MNNDNEVEIEIEDEPVFKPKTKTNFTIRIICAMVILFIVGYCTFMEKLEFAARLCAEKLRIAWTK